MTPERMAQLVARWVRCYTRDLPPTIARRRIDEMDADLHDQIAHERAHGTAEGRIALGIAARMLRGLAADASWRGQISRTSNRKDTTKMRRTATRSVVRVALATAVILLVPLVTTLLSDGEGWSVGDFVFAGILLGGAGLLLEVAARRPRNIAYLAVAIGIGVAAILLGEADDAPGLVLFGLLLIAGTVALGIRARQRSA